MVYGVIVYCITIASNCWIMSEIYYNPTIEYNYNTKLQLHHNFSLIFDLQDTIAEMARSLEILL